MSRFKQCAKVAHAKLRSFFPRITLGQTQQLLAAALGHNTYASFSQADLKVFDGAAAYAVPVPERAMLRALGLGYQLGVDHWKLMLDEINAKQVVGELDLLEYAPNIYWRVKFEFFDGEDSKFDDLAARHKVRQVFRRLVKETVHVEPNFVDSGGMLPEVLMISLQGEVCCEALQSNQSGLAIPVEARYRLDRLGLRLISRPKLSDLLENGEPRDCEPHDELNDAAGMTFD